jgi:transcription elongation factor Elf1
MKFPLENLQALVRCLVCNKSQSSRKVIVLDEQERKTTLHVVCDQCGGASLVYLTLGQMGVVSLGVMTDLEQSEAKRLYQGDPLTSQDVFATHQYLKEYQGDIQDLIF